MPIKILAVEKKVFFYCKSAKKYARKINNVEDKKKRIIAEKSTEDKGILKLFSGN